MNMEQKLECYPLSPMQQGMLFHALSSREPGVDIEQIFCTTPERLDVPAFARAWQRVVDRHEILRTTFHWAGLAEPRQQVHPQATIEFKFEDWCGKSPSEQRDLFEAALQTDRQRGFNLSEKPPLRVALFYLDQSATQFIWTFHHLLLDGRAVAMVLNEVFACYEAFVRGEEPELPPARPFREYGDWLLKQDRSAAEVFWRQTMRGLSGSAGILPAGIGFCAAETRRQDGGAPGNLQQIRGEQETSLSAPVTATLKSLARKNGLTLNTLLQGAWAILLSRYRREDDVVFGAIRAGRRSDVPNAGAIVGLLINTVPVRVHVAPEMPLVSWLQTLRATWNALRDFEHTPLVDIQGWSGVPHGLPLFETIYNYQDPSWDAALRAQGGQWTQREFSIRSQSNYPLAVDAYGGAALKIKILYHRNRFDDEAIARMLGHFKTLLESMAASPEEHIGQLPMLTEGEREQLLARWNDTAAEFPQGECVHQLFEEQVRQTPDALAVADGRKRWSYAELNGRADSLAAELRKLGVGPDICVGVCLERSVEMVAAKLAVWKAGGAYAPLDPSYPAERLKFMFADSKMPVLLTQTSLRENLNFEIPDLKVVCVDELHHVPSCAKPSALNPQPSTTLAYIIYTSGSTGQPKGVEIQHRSLVNLITWHQRTYHITPADRATQIATPAFDAAVWELWPYLTAGASIHIPDEETRLSSRKLLRWLSEQKITLAFVPTPIAEAMLDEAWPDDCELRALFTGGDKLHRTPGENLPCVLVNHYGPTESTVVTTWTPVPPMAENVQPPPIGRPIANIQVFILDPHLQPVPVGVAGELCIGGAGLARGYHHHPELTAEKFISNPFSVGVQASACATTNSGTLKRELQPRLYKTGDLVRWRPDGQVEYLGRMDNQIKIRGQRIEPGEIEAVLARHPDVREAFVVPREDARGDSRLVAYLVCYGSACDPERGLQAASTPAVLSVAKRPEGRTPSISALRDFLKRKLPGAMIPSAFVLLEQLPLTPNGKVDRQALPAPDFNIESDQPFVAPRTPTEEKLSQIWREVLGAERVGIHDNFFDLGGHSLTATRVISRIPGVFQIELPLQDLFDAPTIAELAEKIDGMARNPLRAANVEEQICTPDRRARGDAPCPGGGVPLSFAQERLWFMEQLDPGQSFNNIPIALRLEGALDVGALEQAVTEIVRRHGTLRTKFLNAGGRPVAEVASSPTIKIPIVNLCSLPESERENEAARLMAEEARQPLALTDSPLLRARLIRLPADVHLLLFTTHHIAGDGWSMGIFYHELAILYEAYSQSRPSLLPELRSDYTDYARSQRERMRDDALQKPLAFWKQQLAGAPTALDLPVDRPRPPVQTYRGATRHFSLPPRLARSLNALARQEDATLFMLLLAAFQTLLHRYTGQEDMLIGSPAAGRASVETEQLIGLFLNTLVLRGDLSGDPTFRQLLQRVRHTALAAYAHPDLPFEKLVAALQPARDLSRSPLFQVMFVLQNEPMPSLELAGLKLTPVPVHSGTAKFDLMLSLEESAGGMNGFIEYNSDLFDAETVARLIGHYRMLLEVVAVDPDQRLSQLPLLTEPERKQIFADWNGLHVDFPRDKCVHELFAEQVKRTPDAVALVFEDQTLTYRELDERANHLAGELHDWGVGPDVRVGVCLRRSLDMVIGLLGILKAGGCYVPLDPTYPAERLKFMLEDSQAPVLLTQKSLHDCFKSEVPNLKLFCVDESRDVKYEAQASTLNSLARRSVAESAQPSTSLAYVIYTSGSTGQPKGVMVTHRNVVNFLAGMDRVLSTKPGVWLAVTSISFDISVLEIFWTLARGFKVVIQPDDARGSNEQADGRWRSVPEQILRHGVTHLQCTPSLAGTLVLAPESQTAVRSLEWLLLGGEALPVCLARQLREIRRGELLNLYGPTETTVWSAVHHVDGIGNSIPIGRPLVNTRIYILDRNLQPLPVGVPGEIFIGGEGVARGYLNRPELTAEKFIPHPFSAELKARLYRTGDLGRWLATGTIEFLGRIDQQVKIRGHRIELGEIEAALGAHPAVRECVVAAREDSPGDARLVAYVVAQAPGRAGILPASREFGIEETRRQDGGAPRSMEFSTSELRRFLQDKLPAAMIPAAFVFLDELPRTPNGKVDRRALPAPETARPELETAYLAPGSELEKAIAEIWQELLHIEKVGRHDNFFDLGGNSLLIVRAQSRLQATLGTKLPVVKLFQYPTVHALADFLVGRTENSAGRIRERGQRKRAALARRDQPEEEVFA